MFQKENMLLNHQTGLHQQKVSDYFSNKIKYLEVFDANVILNTPNLQITESLTLEKYHGKSSDEFEDNF